jgi:hypothetical protein
MTDQRDLLTRRRASLDALTTAGLAAAPLRADAQPTVTSGAGHVVLLGDSILDNAGYLTLAAAVRCDAPGPQRWRQ